MARRKYTDPNDALIAIELIRTAKDLIQDPLLSSLYAWYWIQKRSGLGWDDRAALRLGVIDINAARAKVDSSIVVQAMSNVAGMAGDLAKGLGIAKAGAPAALAHGAGEILGPKKKRLPAVNKDIMDMTVKEAHDAGYTFQKVF